MAPALSKEMVSRFAVSDEHAEEVRRFCALSGGETSAVSKLMDALNDPLMVPKKTADQLALGVQLLTSWWGSFLLTGYPSAFESLSRADRAAAVEGMLTSSLELRRSFAHGMRCLLCIIALSSVTPPTAVNPKGISSPFTPLATAANTPSGAAFAARASDGSSPRPGVRSNPSHAAMQYPGPDPDGDHARSLQARRLAFRHEPIVLPPPGASPALAASALAAAAAGQAPSPLSAVAAAFAGELARRAGVPRAFLPHVIITPAALQLLNVHCGVSASSASVSSPFESAFGPNNINPATGLLIPPNVALDSDSALPTLALAADVVIIGSGAGGGVAAAALARDGRRVLVLEKGQYYSPDELNHIEEDSMQSMYEGRSLLTTDDGGMAILAGATLGGGTTVNWACSLDLPHYVRHEWARHHALPFVASPVFARALESVSRRVGVHCGDSVARAHSGPNTLLLRGAKALGHPAVTLPQNTPGPGAHNCGWCGMGCRTGTKQGSQFSFLRDAVEKGAKVITGCYVEKIIIRDAADISAGASAGAAGTGAKAAGSKPADTGVHAPAGPGADGAAAAAAAGASASVPLYGPVTPDGAFNSAGGDAAFALAATADAAAAVSPAEAAAAASELPHRSVAVTGINAIVASPHGRLRLQISAPLVISAAGALHSPLLLRRSGVRNPHLGQNLRLHPVVGVCAVFDQGVACDAQALQAAREKLAAEARACATADDAAAGDASATAVAAEKKKQHRRPAVTSPAATSGADSFNTLCDAAAAEGVPESAVFRDGRLRAGVVTREVDCFRGAIMTSVNNIVENYEVRVVETM
jgi:choline dehydrogenase-like flavoprotein